eukprot:COSAG01_NODE_24948_length_760_cov_8.809380_1_plen_60_part_10
MEDYYSKSPIVLYGATVCDTPKGVSQTVAKDSNPRPHSVINTRSDLAGWPRTTWYHIESL